MKKIKSIGIRSLKDRLSSVIREAGSGTTYLITDRDEVVAQLSQPALLSLEGTKGALLGELVRSGVIKLPEQAPRYQKSGVRLRATTSRALLKELRDEA